MWGNFADLASPQPLSKERGFDGKRLKILSFGEGFRVRLQGAVIYSLYPPL
jgi:hypothetical protein